MPKEDPWRGAIGDRDAAVDDPSNGYESVALEYIRRRAASSIGLETVRTWSRSLPRGGSILDLGCGCGVPISTMLSEEGFAVCGIDASPKMIAAFRGRLPHAPVACEAIEDSGFFGRTFDGVVAVGLMFLLTAEVQRRLIRKVAAALNPGGRFLFTCPAQVCVWNDILTGRESRSLGADEYRSALTESGLALVAEYEDAGDNHYFDASRGFLEVSRAVPEGEK